MLLIHVRCLRSGVGCRSEGLNSDMFDLPHVASRVFGTQLMIARATDRFAPVRSATISPAPRQRPRPDAEIAFGNVISCRPPISRNLLWSDVGRPDHLAPLFRFRGN